jgi:putative oxidoreductase
VDLARLVLRLLVGGLFVGHGTQKLFGWFGGDGLEGTGQMFESIGLRPGRRHAALAGATEAGSGVLLAAGAATPLAAAGLSGVMVTAIRHVHWRNGVWNTSGGYEYNAVILATLAGLVETGPGRWSVDAALGRVRHGTWWALGALGAGALGSVALARAAEDEEFDQEAADRPPVAASS